MPGSKPDRSQPTGRCRTDRLAGLNVDHSPYVPNAGNASSPPTMNGNKPGTAGRNGSGTSATMAPRSAGSGSSSRLNTNAFSPKDRLANGDGNAPCVEPGFTRDATWFSSNA